MKVKGWERIKWCQENGAVRYISITHEIVYIWSVILNVAFILFVIRVDKISFLRLAEQVFYNAVNFEQLFNFTRTLVWWNFILLRVYVCKENLESGHVGPIGMTNMFVS